MRRAGSAAVWLACLSAATALAQTPAPETPAPGTPPAAAPAPATPPAEPATPPAAPAPAPMPKALQARTQGAMERGWWWDLNVEGGGGLWIQPGRPLIGMGRIRGGAMYMAEPWYFTLGAVYEINSLSPAAFGGQFEALHLWSGWSFQLGGEVNVSGQAGLIASLGYAIFGVESQTWTGANLPQRTALLVKVRLPISWLFQIGKPPRLPSP